MLRYSFTIGMKQKKIELHSSGNILLNGGPIFANKLNSDAGTAILITGSDEIVIDSSSKRYKKNITPLTIDTNKLYDLEPVEFDFKKSGTHSIGFIAEDFQEQFPELVVYNKKGEPSAIMYNKITILIVNEMISLKKEVERLNNLILDMQGYK